LNEDKWQFTESVNYLRTLGALDESDATLGPRVLLANYVAARTNCVADNRHYAVCCRSRCEALREQLERSISAPDATPGAIAAAIAAGNISSNSAAVLGSASPGGVEQGGLALTAPMMQKLEEIAQRHRGRVPLHGRLFTQWLHFAYPRDCPYPHEAGVARPVDSDAWLADTDEDSSATEEEMTQFVAEAAASRTSAQGESASSAATTVPPLAGSDLGMWTSAEELVAPRTGMARRPTPRTWRNIEPMEAIRGVALLAAASSLLYTILMRADSLYCFITRTEEVEEKAEKYHM